MGRGGGEGMGRDRGNKHVRNTGPRWRKIEEGRWVGWGEGEETGHDTPLYVPYP